MSLHACSNKWPVTASPPGTSAHHHSAPHTIPPHRTPLLAPRPTPPYAPRPAPPPPTPRQATAHPAPQGSGYGATSSSKAIASGAATATATANAVTDGEGSATAAAEAVASGTSTANADAYVESYDSGSQGSASSKVSPPLLARILPGQRLLQGDPPAADSHLRGAPPLQVWGGRCAGAGGGLCMAGANPSRPGHAPARRPWRRARAPPPPPRTCTSMGAPRAPRPPRPARTGPARRRPPSGMLLLRTTLEKDPPPARSPQMPAPLEPAPPRRSLTGF